MLLRAVLSDSGFCVEDHRRLRRTLVIGRASARTLVRPMARCAVLGSKAGRPAIAKLDRVPRGEQWREGSSGRRYLRVKIGSVRAAARHNDPLRLLISETAGGKSR
jgi:hypothetical protein